MLLIKGYQFFAHTLPILLLTLLHSWAILVHLHLIGFYSSLVIPITTRRPLTHKLYYGLKHSLIVAHYSVCINKIYLNHSPKDFSLSHNCDHVHYRNPTTDE
jgi:hypothetical protein